jgi:signal peptidase II
MRLGDQRHGREHLADSAALSYLGDLFRLQYAENQGALLGLGSCLAWSVRIGVFTGVVGAMLLTMFVFTLMRHELRLASTASMGLMIGGGLSNIVDRLLHQGAIVDFMNFGLGNLRTGIFNVADVAISMGGILLCLSTLHHPPETCSKSGSPAAAD